MIASLKAKLLLNACKAPLSAWRGLQNSASPDALWTEGEPLWKKLGLRPSSCTRLAELLSDSEWAEREGDKIDRFGAHFITIDDPIYPARLKDLPSPPIGLYVKGNLDDLMPALGIVGTRKCSHYGRTVAEALGKAASHMGHQVISGGAKGIDGAAHSGCLKAGGTTIAVLGTAVDRVYPAEHHALFREIAERGALVSEYPMGTGGDPWRFPERNRIIVGLCNRLVIAESPEDGGSMITARLALELGREIWCVPGRITDSISRGSNALIRDGANPLVDVDEFMARVSGKYGQMLLDFGTPVPPLSFSEDEKTLLELLRRKGARTLDDLMVESSMDFVRVQTCLINLCATGVVFASGPGRYSAGL